MLPAGKFWRLSLSELFVYSSQWKLVEALTDTGVRTFDFHGFYLFDWFRNYKGIYFRKLHCLRDSGFRSAVAHCTRQWIGLPYSIKSTLVSQQGNYRSFFCSELIAAYYAVLGLLPSSVPASKYWPADFGKDLQMERGAFLGEIAKIVFKPPPGSK